MERDAPARNLFGGIGRSIRIACPQMVYHIFQYCIDGIWYRDSQVCSDAQFDAIMDQLQWRLPTGMRVFHFGAPGPQYYPLDNPIVLRRPTLSLDPVALAAGVPLCRAALNDRHTHLRIPVLHRNGRFVICGSQNVWPCFRYLDGKRYALITELRIIPLTFREAKEYVQRYHRHNAAPQGHKFSIGLITPGEDRYIGVAIASIPKARHLNDGFTLEINRVCCDPAFFNACSKLYGAAVKAGKAMGYTRFITYTIPEEGGGSVRAAGFRLDGTVPGRKDGWRRNDRCRTTPCRAPTGPKLRWVIDTQPTQNHGNCDE